MKSYIKGDTYFTMYESLGDFYENNPLTPPESAKDLPEENYNSWLNQSRDDSCEWRYGSSADSETYHQNKLNAEIGKSLCISEVKKSINSSEFKRLLEATRTYKRGIVFKDCGNRFSVSKAIAGESDYFIQTRSLKRPTAKIGINMCASAGADESDLQKIAKTAVPIVFALEQVGIPTEVVFCDFTSNGYNTSEFTHFVTQVPLKSAQQRFNWSTFGPVFQPASLRETFFISQYNKPYEIYDGLGSPMKESVMEQNNNYGFHCIIGVGGPGPIEEIQTIFKNLYKKDA